MMSMFAREARRTLFFAAASFSALRRSSSSAMMDCLRSRQRIGRGEDTMERTEKGQLSPSRARTTSDLYCGRRAWTSEDSETGIRVDTASLRSHGTWRGYLGDSSMWRVFMSEQADVTI